MCNIFITFAAQLQKCYPCITKMMLNFSFLFNDHLLKE